MKPLLLICLVLILTCNITSQTTRDFSFNQINSFNNPYQFADQFKDTVYLNIPNEKSPWLAFLFSYIFPGGGQIYNGQPVKGLLFLTGITVGAGIAILGNPGSDFESTQADNAFLYTGIGLAGLFYIWQLIDAPVTASNINEERRIKLNRAELEILPQISDKGLSTTFKLYFY